MARNKGKRPSGANRPDPKREASAESRPEAAADPGETGVGDAATGSRESDATRPAAAGAERSGDGGEMNARPVAATDASTPRAGGGGASAATSAGGRPSDRAKAGGPAGGGRDGEGAGGPGGRGPSAPPPASGGGAGAWVRGFVGGVVGGVAVWLAVTYLVTPGPGVDVDVEALQARVDQLGEQVETVQATGTDLSELASRVEAFEGRPGVGELTARVDALEEALTGIETDDPRVADLEARVETLEADAGQAAAADPEALDNLRARLATLETELAEFTAEGGGGEATGEAGTKVDGLTGRLDEIEARLSDLEGEVASAEQIAGLEQRLTDTETAAAQVAGLEERLAETEAAGERIQTLAATIEDMAAAAASRGERLDALVSQVEALAGEVEALGGRLETTSALSEELADRLDSLAQEVEATRQQLEQAAAAEERAAALAVLTAELDAALDRGAPFADVLEPLESVGEDPAIADAIATLEPLAADGVPTLPALRRGFADIASEIVHAGRDPEGEGLIDRATGNLMRLVTVRPVGAEVEGEGAAARVARAEAALADGDLERAVAEIEPLDGAAAEVAAPWLEDARTRLAAVSTLADLQRHTARLLAEGQ